MKTTTLFSATLLALAVLGAPVAAQDPAGDARPARKQLDGNGDGAIDRAEAASHPRLAERFERLDRNGDGRLDASERPAHHRKRPHGGHDRMGHGGIVRLDTDGDGRLTRAELEAAAAERGMGDARGGRGARHGLLQSFEAIDADNDGHIVRGELRAWHQAQRPQRQAEMVRRAGERFTAADLNGDGRLSRVEVEEKLPRMAAGFAWMDENRDGFLSREELSPGPMH